MNAEAPIEGLAIIGMSGKFPGAPNLEIFWQNLRQGVETVTHFRPEELEFGSGADTVNSRAILSDVDLFDAAFFGFTPREAQYTDPQHRLFLETAFSALEDAGYDPDRFPGNIGLFAGCSQNTYLLANLVSDPGFLREYLASQQMGSHPSLIGSDKDFLATRVSYKLNLRGPSMTIQTACSTSLVAISQACQSLQNFECDLALAGGASITFPQKRGCRYEEGAIISRDGHCRPFDAACDGTVFGDGVGAVLLKRADEAVRDGDHIHAIIRGFAVNNDGSAKVSYMAPSVEGQAEVVATALALSGIEPRTVTYIEAHGTGTSLGDPIEVAALTKAFRSHTSDIGFCAIGSLKGNQGHIEAASGVAGLIKTVLALQHRELPPSLHFSTPNPRIDFANSPFFVNAALREWKPVPGELLRAGVSSFGVGGTNAHLVIEEAPALSPVSDEPGPQLLVLSARSAAALEAATERLVEHFRAHPEINLADAAYTLQTGRRVFNHRRAIVATSTQGARDAIAKKSAANFITADTRGQKKEIAFLFPGQGAQEVDMGRGLYESLPAYRESVDLCAQLLQPRLGLDLRDILYPTETNRAAAHKQLLQTWLTQPALFVVEYALAQVWLKWGARPAVMVGHSLGEYVAACLAGVFSLEDALHVLAERGHLMQGLPSGTMLAVLLPEAELATILPAGLSLAAVNSAKVCVVSGPDELAARWKIELKQKGIGYRELATSHAFHSAMMDPILATFEQVVQSVGRKPASVPIISTLHGALIDPKAWCEPSYWSGQLRHTVRFGAALDELLTRENLAMVEVGPGQILTALARQHAARKPAQLGVYSLPRNRETSDGEALLSALGQLWTAGIPADWAGVHAPASRRRVSLPNYPFERERHWVESPLTKADPATPTEPAVIPAESLSATSAPKAAPDVVEQLVAGQLQIMRRQLSAMRNLPRSRPGNGVHKS